MLCSSQGATAGACGTRTGLDAEAHRKGFDSLKTEEKTVVDVSYRSREENLYLCRSPATTHQCTNWDVQTPGDLKIANDVEWTP